MVGSLDQQRGSRSTQRQHLAAVRLLFDSLMMRGVVEYNPAARARPPRLIRESFQTSVFEEAEIVTFLDSIYPNSLKDIRDKAIFSVLLCASESFSLPGPYFSMRTRRSFCSNTRTLYSVSLSRS